MAKYEKRNAEEIKADKEAGANKKEKEVKIADGKSRGKSKGKKAKKSKK